MSQDSVLRMAAEADTRKAQRDLQDLGTEFRRFADEALKAAEASKGFIGTWNAAKSGLFEGIASSLDSAARSAGDILEKTQQAGRAVGDHLPRARKHVEDYALSWQGVTQRVREATEGFERQLGPALGAFGLKALGATASIGGLIEAVRHLGESGAAMENLSRHSGFAMRSVEGWVGMAREVGVSADSMSSSIETLGEKFSQAQRFDLGGLGGMIAKVRASLGGAGAAADMQRIVQGPGNDEEKRLKFTERYLQLLDQVRATHSESYTREYAAETSGFPDIANLTRMTAEQRKAAEELAVAQRGAFNFEDVHKYEVAMNHLNDSIVGLQRALGTELIGDMARLADAAAKFITANKDDAGHGIANAVKEIASSAKEALPDFQSIKSIIDFIQQFDASHKGSMAQKGATWIREHGGQQVGDYLHTGQWNNDYTWGLEGQNERSTPHKDLQEKLNDIPPIQGFDVGSEGITRSGLGILHEGEKVVPAESAGPFGQIHNEEATRNLQENTQEIKKLNEKLDKLLENADQDNGWGPGTGTGSGSGRGSGGGGPGGGGPGGSGPGGGGPGGSSSSGPGGGLYSDPGADSAAGHVGTPGGASFEDSQAVSKPGGYASALGLDKFPASAPANHPAMAAAQAQARNMSTGGATGGGAGAAGITGSGSGFSPVGGGGLGTAAGGGNVAADARGNVNPNALFQSYVSHFKGSKLDGYVPEDGAKFGITKGTPEEWARLAIASTAQESGVNAHVRDGLNQFNANDLRNYGVNGAVTDPNAQIQAQVNQWTSAISRDHVISGAGRGPHGSWGGASAYFGPFRRFGQTNELSKHFGWADKIARANTSATAPDASASASPPSPPSVPDGVHPPAVDPQGVHSGAAVAEGAALAPTGKNPNAFIVHHTDGHETPESLVRFWQQQGKGYGTRYFMDRNAVVHDLYKEFPNFRNRGGIKNGWGQGAGLNNNNTVQMEVAAFNNKDVLEKQRLAGSRFIEQNYPNTPVFGHGEVNPGHKEADEGMAIVNTIRHDRAAGTQVASAPQAPPSQGLKPWPSDAPKAPSVADDAPKPPTAPEAGGWKTHDLKSWPEDGKVGGAYSIKGDTFVAGSSGHLNASDYDAEVKKRFGDGDTPRAGELSAKAGRQRAEEMKHSVEGKGSIDVHVRAPRGTDVKAKGSGLFQKTSLNRSFAGERSPEHSNPSETHPR